MGKIEVTIVAARNLHNGQLIGVPDPFVRLISEDKNYKTKVIKNQLDPKWDETFRFMVADENSCNIKLEVWNKGTYSDDLMGNYSITVGGLTKGVVRDDWYILDKSKTQAELRVRILAVDFGREPKPEEAWMVTNDITRDPVERAIADGKWRPGQKATPQPAAATPAPPPPQQAPPPQQQQPYSPAPQQGGGYYQPQGAPPPQQGGGYYQQAPPTAPQGYQQGPQQGGGYYQQPQYSAQRPPSQQYAPPPQQYAPPPTQYAPPPTQYAPPPTQYAPPPQQYAPPPTQYAPPPQQYAPPSQPAQAYNPNQPGYRY